MPIKIVNLALGCTALAFQIGVLYPWHHEISKQVDKLEIAVSKL